MLICQEWFNINLIFYFFRIHLQEPPAKIGKIMKFSKVAKKLGMDGSHHIYQHFDHIMGNKFGITIF